MNILIPQIIGSLHGLCRKKQPIAKVLPEFVGFPVYNVTMTEEEKINVFKEKYRRLSPGGWVYYLLGEAGKSLLFLSGGLGKAVVAYEMLELLSRDYRVVAPDYKPVSHMEDVIEGLVEILDGEKIKKVHLVGQSYGGVVAQYFCQIRPERVAEAVLSNTGPAYIKAYQMALLSTGKTLTALLPEPVIKGIFQNRLLKLISFKEDREEQFRRAINHIIKEEIEKSHIRSFFSTLHSVGREQRKGIPGKIPHRVTILTSDDDPIKRAFGTSDYYRLIEKPIFKSMENRGHTIYLKEPALFRDTLKGILTPS